MASRRRSGVPLAENVPLLRSGWPTGTALLSEDSLVELETLADDPPAGSLVVFVSPFTDVAADAAELLGRGVLGTDMSRDYRVLRPGGERWTVAEVEELLVSLQRYPARRHVVVLAEGSRMDPRSLDRLLKTLEEPPTPLLVVLTVPRLEDVPATLRGRSSATLLLEVLPESRRVSALVALGLTQTAATEAVSLAFTRPSLAGLLGLESPLRPMAKEVFDPRLDHAHPVEQCAERLHGAARIAAVLEQVQRDASGEIALLDVSFEDLSPVGKAIARDLLGVFVAHRRRLLTGLLGQAQVDDLPLIEANLEALEEFLLRLRVPLTPMLALCALYASSPPLRARRERVR